MRYQKKGLLLILALSAIGILALAIWCWRDFQSIPLHEALENELEPQLGFITRTPDIPEGEVFMLVYVNPEGPLGRAGAQSRDIILGRWGSTKGFYDYLKSRRGKSARISLKRGDRIFSVHVPVPKRPGGPRVWTPKDTPLSIDQT
jgi:hypothetical protein